MSTDFSEALSKIDVLKNIGRRNVLTFLSIKYMLHTLRICKLQISANSSNIYKSTLGNKKNTKKKTSWFLFSTTFKVSKKGFTTFVCYS